MALGLLVAGWLVGFGVALAAFIGGGVGAWGALALFCAVAPTACLATALLLYACSVTRPPSRRVAVTPRPRRAPSAS